MWEKIKEALNGIIESIWARSSRSWSQSSNAKIGQLKPAHGAIKCYVWNSIQLIEISTWQKLKVLDDILKTFHNVKNQVIWSSMDQVMTLKCWLLNTEAGGLDSLTNWLVLSYFDEFFLPITSSLFLHINLFPFS